MIEVWKSIPDYEGIYEVSSLGRVKSLSRENYSGKGMKIMPERLLKQNLDNYGYYMVKLYFNGIGRTFRIHKLVAMAFLDHTPCGYKLVIDHINDNTKDNRVENLQIVTQRENAFKTQGNYSSKYKGVGFDNSRNKWYSRIYIDGKVKHLGRFESEHNAHLAYQQALKEIQ
jgi:hypothetical protein